jgi:hypothetical protein
MLQFNAIQKASLTRGYQSWTGLLRTIAMRPEKPARATAISEMVLSDSSPCRIHAYWIGVNRCEIAPSDSAKPEKVDARMVQRR